MLVKPRSVKDVEKYVEKITTTRTSFGVGIIVNSVAGLGDSSILEFEKSFGTPPTNLRVTQHDIAEAHTRVSTSEIAAVKAAAKRIKKAEIMTKKLLRKHTLHDGGIRVSREFIPLRSVGCYVPGGKARYPSSAIMSVIPAKVAGVKHIAVASPPNSDGKIDPLTLVAADICGATDIYCMGGAQAIAALAYGTQTVHRVDKIVGPGGPVVSAAKSIVSSITSSDYFATNEKVIPLNTLPSMSKLRDTPTLDPTVYSAQSLASRTVAIDMTAGPTELGIVADSFASPDNIALDMVSQAEHSQDSMCFLATNSVKIAREVSEILDEIVDKSSRSTIIRASLKNHGFIAICKTKRDALRLAELAAPEHVQIMTKSAQRDASLIHSAGLILIGSTPSAASDYMLGSNHILPTQREGRTRGPLSVLDFLKMRTTVYATHAELKRIMPYIETFADAEGLPGHAEAVRGRIL